MVLTAFIAITGIKAYNISDFDFWKNLIQYEINEEMIKQKKYNMLNKENDEYKLKRIQLIVKSNLIFYRRIMFFYRKIIDDSQYL